MSIYIYTMYICFSLGHFNFEKDILAIVQVYVCIQNQRLEPVLFGDCLFILVYLDFVGEKRMEKIMRCCKMMTEVVSGQPSPRIQAERGC